jgi:transcriptional regulator with XRE-family HTH domain
MTQQFGKYLRDARKAAGIQTQQQAVEELEKLGRRVSQALIAQYEAGKVKDPDPTILCLMAKLYKKDYMETVFQLVQDKYGACDENAKSEVFRERWKLWEAALKPFKSVGRVENLEAFQLRAKISLLQQEILTVEGLAEWEKNYPDLEVIWIVASNALNDSGSKILESVIHNMKRNVQMVYFVQKRDIERGGRFWILQRTLNKSDTSLYDHTPKPPVAVPVGEDELGWLNTDIIIANPHWQEHAAGFKYIRRGRGGPSYAMRMSSFELGDMIRVLSRYAGQKIDEQEMERVLPQKPHFDSIEAVH